MWVSAKALKRAMEIYEWIQDERCNITREFLEVAANNNQTVTVGTVSYTSETEVNGQHIDSFRVDLEYNLRVNTDWMVATVRSDPSVISLLNRMVSAGRTGAIKSVGPGYIRFLTPCITDATYRAVKSRR